MGKKNKKRKNKKRIKNMKYTTTRYEKSNKQEKKTSTVRNMVTAAFLLPVVIGFSISTMAVSYMLVPLGVVLIIGTIVYQTVKANRN